MKVLDRQGRRVRLFRGRSDLTKIVQLMRELGPIRSFAKLRRIGLQRLHIALFEPVLTPSDCQDTPTEILLSEVTTVGPSEVYGSNYVPTPSRVFNRLLAELSVEPSKFGFVDLGCGNGRLLLLAAEFGFRDVLGVEFSVELAEQARKRIAEYKRRSNAPLAMVCHTMDATDFIIPDGPCIIFMFNPFSGPVMGKVVRNLEASHRTTPRELYVIYYNPVHTNLFDGEMLSRRRRLSLGTRLYLSALSPYGATIYESRI